MRRTLLLIALCLVSCALYLGATFVQVGKHAFPLDDAWIHLTFARNLALYHEFAFMPGQPSAGSTSPLWTFVIAPGFWWPFGPDAWIYFVGVVLLYAGALLTARVTQRLFPDAPHLPTLSAIVCALEWHLNWAAYSGMETLFFVVLLLLMLDVYFARKPLWWVGLLGGLTVITRPEGVGMLGLIVAHAMLEARRWKLEIRSWKLELGSWDFIALAIAFILPVLPYVWFNWSTSGLLLPNTFYAKQAEYAEVFANTSLPERILNLSAITFVGAQILLVPGFIYAAWLIRKERRWAAAILLAWWLLLPIVYALRLPVTYQYARYEMPVIPAIIILGVWGTWWLGQRLPVELIGRVARRVWLLTFAVLLLAFWGIGAQRRAIDVATMDCLVLQAARWLAANTQPHEVIAVHDVGAVGYTLNDRPLLDLAGLITPDVILFVRDEPRLMQFMLDRHTSYLVTSAAWHPNLTKDPRVREVYHGDCPLARREGGYELSVYRLSAAPLAPP